MSDGPEVSPTTAVRFGCTAAGAGACVAPVPFGSTAGSRHSSSRARPPSPTCRALRWMAACRLRACLCGCAVCAARRIGRTPAWPRVRGQSAAYSRRRRSCTTCDRLQHVQRTGRTGRSPWRGRGCKPSHSDSKIRRALCRAAVPSFLRRHARAHCHPIPVNMQKVTGTARQRQARRGPCDSWRASAQPSYNSSCRSSCTRAKAASTEDAPSHEF